MIDPRVIELDPESWDELKRVMSNPPAPTPGAVEANRRFCELLAEGRRTIEGMRL